MDFQSLANKAFPSQHKNHHYEELYNEVKKNTATFIQLVENEVSKLLHQHNR